MNHLLRSQAPISDIGWRELDREAQQHLLPALASRRVVDFSGPLGWEHSATNLGRVSNIDPPDEALLTSQRRVLPLAELRSDFAISRPSTPRLAPTPASQPISVSTLQIVECCRE